MAIRLALFPLLFAVTLLAGCWGMDRPAAQSAAMNAASTVTPASPLAGKWTLDAPGGGSCTMNFGAQPVNRESMDSRQQSAVAPFLFSGARMKFSAQAQQKPLKLWYDKPAEKWTDALPIGNGSLGAMIYGGVAGDLEVVCRYVILGAFKAHAAFRAFASPKKKRRIPASRVKLPRNPPMKLTASNS